MNQAVTKITDRTAVYRVKILYCESVIQSDENLPGNTNNDVIPDHRH